MYSLVWGRKEGLKGHVCYVVEYEIRKIGVDVVRGLGRIKANGTRGGLEEENGDGELWISANATIFTADDFAGMRSRERVRTEVAGEHEMDRKVLSGIVEVIDSRSSSQQQGKGLPPFLGDGGAVFQRKEVRRLRMIEPFFFLFLFL